MSRKGTFYGSDLALHFQDSSTITCSARDQSGTGIELVNLSVEGPVSVSFYLSSERARTLATELYLAADMAEGIE